ncbi:uncharacterized protein J3D65DRAFT_605531 [Phyllosticta citribraziliensis]|uniref:Uncharacterized protein n=1 Tax=Phyllosticta citribraziliensis TaxID=989973 RepID=A0ABR1LCI6_9PEZI
MQFSTIVALLATTVAAAPFNSTIEARGLNETSALLPRGLNVTRIVESRGLNDTSVLLSRGLNDTSVLVGRSANVTVRSYNATKRGESASFPHVNLPKPVSGIFEGNKNIHALPNKTTNDVKRSYGSFGTGSGEEPPQRQEHLRRADETSALVSPPQPAVPVTAVIPATTPSNATTPSPWKSPLRRLQRHFRRQELRFQAQAQDQAEPQSRNASTATAANTQKRKANANAAPVAAACASSGMDVHPRQPLLPDFSSSDTSRKDFNFNGDGGDFCAVNTTTGSRAATATRCCRCLLRSAMAAEAAAALPVDDCAHVARVATITALPAVSTPTADGSSSSSPSPEPLEISAAAITERELPSLSGLGRGNTLISLWVATLFMTLFCDYV